MSIMPQDPDSKLDPPPSADAIAFGMWSLTHNLWTDHHADWQALPEKEKSRRRAHARWVLSMARSFDERT